MAIDMKDVYVYIHIYYMYTCKYIHAYIQIGIRQIDDRWMNGQIQIAAHITMFQINKKYSIFLLFLSIVASAYAHFAVEETVAWRD